MQCSSHNTAPGHLHVTSGHLECIEAPARGEHSALMRGPTKATTTATKRSTVTKTAFSNEDFVAFAIVVFFVFGFSASASAAVVDPELVVVIRTYDASAAAGDLTLAQAAAT